MAAEALWALASAATSVVCIASADAARACACSARANAAGWLLSMLSMFTSRVAGPGITAFTSASAWYASAIWCDAKARVPDDVFTTAGGAPAAAASCRGGSIMPAMPKGVPMDQDTVNAGVRRAA